MGFKSRVLKELKEIMYIKDFSSMLDSAPDRLSIRDGIILVRKDSVDICRMRMQYMCSMSIFTDITLPTNIPQ